MTTRRNVIAAALAIGGAGVVGRLYLNERDDDRGPLVPSSDYAPGNVVIENWDDVSHTLTLVARVNREYTETATETSTEPSPDEPAFETELTVEGPGTRLVPDAITDPDIYRVTVRTEADVGAVHNNIRLWQRPAGDLAGDAIRVRIYGDGSLNLVGFSDENSPDQ